MRRVKLITVILVTFFLGVSLVCAGSETTMVSTSWWDTAKKSLVEKPRPDPKDHAIYKKFPGMDKPYTGSLPWEQDPDFQAALREHGTPVLMAAYKAVLPVPVEAEGHNIKLAADQLAGTVVAPGETFSQNETLGPYTEEKGYRSGPTYAGNRHITTVGGGVCKIASMLYNVVTFGDLPVTRRDCHSMTVPYVPPGQDATVYYGARDFRFQNDTDGPVMIWSRRVDKILYMALYGQQKPPPVTWHHEIKKKINFTTEYRYNSALPPGTEKVTAPGQDGYIVRSWVTLEMPDGKVVTKKKYPSWYNASPRIIERGPRQ